MMTLFPVCLFERPIEIDIARARHGERTFTMSTRRFGFSVDAGDAVSPS